MSEPTSAQLESRRLVRLGKERVESVRAVPSTQKMRD